MFENTDHFYFIPCRESKQLLIIFSGAGARSFNCFNLLKDYPINRLFIRDETRSWYQSPVAGHWLNIDGIRDDTIFSDLGLSAIQAREYEKAESAFRMADQTSLTPSAMYLSKLGATLMLQKRYDEAIAMQLQALQVNANHTAAYYQLGLVMNITGRYDEAVPMFEKAIEMGDKNPNTQRHLTTAREKLSSPI